MGQNNQTAPAERASTTSSTTVTYTQSKSYVLSIGGGFLILSIIKAFLFRFDHPDLFVEALACVMLFIMGLAFWFPSKLVLSSAGVKGSSFGFIWIDIPWEAVASISAFRTPIIQTMGQRPTGGRRAIGFCIRQAFKGQVRPKTGSYGYDAAILSMWDMPLDRVAEQCVSFWHAAGGHGELINHLETYASDQLELDR